ncbi:hypothetical protein D5E69_22795 (plasmid) [Rossellomorea marisflavi]|uniref:hypothetical protein n=1 Tax=Rossellomorea marisflavi TaxID=189381 RepID=UPI001316E3B2|nr:hypothetical protein [Rossellomorea marisflavi]QHA38670.1 hypothetical protein D5E69_22795 [Rossellomorea marisflavi]
MNEHSSMTAGLFRSIQIDCEQSGYTLCMFVKAIGGFITNSLALLFIAWHV